jgi:hypothetical protein
MTFSSIQKHVKVCAFQRRHLLSTIHREWINQLFLSLSLSRSLARSSSNNQQSLLFQCRRSTHTTSVQCPTTYTGHSARAHARARSIRTDHQQTVLRIRLTVVLPPATTDRSRTEIILTRRRRNWLTFHRCRTGYIRRGLCSPFPSCFAVGLRDVIGRRQHAVSRD